MIINDLSTLLWFNRLPEDLLWQSISSPLSEHYREEMDMWYAICDMDMDMDMDMWYVSTSQVEVCQASYVVCVRRIALV